jgi:radical SAM protein with 4Fe4S-binding SPASM domain
MHNLSYLSYLPTGLSYLLRSERAWGSPIFFTIETVNVCNFRCVYCPQSDEEAHFVNGRGVMSLEDFQRIIANLQSAFDVRAVSLHRDGEPLLNKRIEDFVAHLTARGIFASFSSNCSLVDPARAAKLLEVGLRMVKTDFCADRELYERLRVRGDWEQTRSGIETFLELAHAKGLDFRVNITDLATHGKPASEAQALMQRTRELFPRFRDRVGVTGIRLHNALGESKADLSGKAVLTPPGKYSLCHQPWVNLTVDFAGRVVACCRDLRSEYVLGNLLEQPAAAIWNGARMRGLRRALLDRKPEQINVCGACDVPWHGSYSGRTPLGKVANFFFSKTWKRETATLRE